MRKVMAGVFLPTEPPFSFREGLYSCISAPSKLPSGGSAGNILAKTSTGTEWTAKPEGLPSGGSTGQVLTKTSSGSSWADVPKEIPTGGSDGQLLAKNGSSNYSLKWINAPESLPAHGSGVTGYLKSTSGTLSWASAPDVTRLYQSNTNYAELNTSRQLVPSAAGSSTYPYSLGSSNYPWYSLYVSGGTIQLGTNANASVSIGYASGSYSASKLGFWGKTAIVRQQLSSSTSRSEYSKATDSNHLKVLNNLVSILYAYGLITTD